MTEWKRELGINVAQLSGSWSGTNCQGMTGIPEGDDTRGTFNLMWGERDMGKRNWFLNVRDAAKSILDVNQCDYPTAVANISPGSDESQGIYIIVDPSDLG